MWLKLLYWTKVRGNKKQKHLSVNYIQLAIAILQASNEHSFQKIKINVDVMMHTYLNFCAFP